MNKNFKPNHDQVLAAKNLILAMAHQQLVEPIITAYQREILAANQWRIKSEFVELGCKDEVITDPKRAYLLSEKDAGKYFALIEDAKKSSGLKVSNPDFCPLLEAETFVLDARRAMVEVMEPVTGITWDQLMNNFKLFPQYIDLTLKVMAPFVGSADEILQELAA